MSIYSACWCFRAWKWRGALGFGELIFLTPSPLCCTVLGPPSFVTADLILGFYMAQYADGLAQFTTTHTALSAYLSGRILFDTSSVRYQSTHTSRVAIFPKRAGPIRFDQFFFPVSIFEQILNWTYVKWNKFQNRQILIDFKFSQIFKFEHILNGTDFQIWTYFKWNRF
jgi:hypothetical protein